HRARSSRKKTPPHRAMRLRRRDSRPDRGRLRLAPKRSVAPVELHLQQPEYAQTLRLTGTHYRLANIRIGGIASNHGKSRRPTLRCISAGNDTIKVTDALLFGALFDF